MQIKGVFVGAWVCVCCCVGWVWWWLEGVCCIRGWWCRPCCLVVMEKTQYKINIPTQNIIYHL